MGARVSIDEARLEAIGAAVRVIVLASAAVPVQDMAALEDAGALAHEPVLEAFAEFRARLEGVDLGPWIEAEEQPVAPLCPRCGLEEAGSGGFCLDCEFDYAAESRAAREEAAITYRRITGVNIHAVSAPLRKRRMSG
jgi:hypothetical protein